MIPRNLTVLFGVVAEVVSAQQEWLMSPIVDFDMGYNQCSFDAFDFIPIPDKEAAESDLEKEFDVTRYASESPLEKLRLAAAELPIPEYVMNDKVRSYKPTEEELYFTLDDGRYVNRIYSGVKLREFE